MSDYNPAHNRLTLNTARAIASCINHRQQLGPDSSAIVVRDGLVGAVQVDEPGNRYFIYDMDDYDAVLAARFLAV